MYLYETHLPVKSIEISRRFYTDVVGLELAHRDRTRDAVFMWIGSNRRSMLGLWGPSTKRGSDFHLGHFAIAVSLPELLAHGRRLNDLGIRTRNFAGEETLEPSVIGWVPCAQLYFRDPDDHSLEYIAVLDDPPDPEFIDSLSTWQAKCGTSA